MLPGSDLPLAELHDFALVDLDGVVYAGEAAVPGAVAALAQARELGMRWAAVTNNALRSPSQVAAHLRRIGLAASPADVITSSMAAARQLAERLPPRAPVLVCGGAGLRLAVAEQGLLVLEDREGAAQEAAAVVTGHDPATTYARLAEASFALMRGVPWVASNTDANAPGPRGLFPGAGAVVAFLATACGREPDVVAGKPNLAMHEEMMLRTGAKRPLIVGDRLDTDIAGARRARVPSLVVLSGVAQPTQLMNAPPGQRPDHLAWDLSGLLESHPAATAEGGLWHVRAATATVATNGRLECHGQAGPDGLDILRAACAATWEAADRGVRVDLRQMDLQAVRPSATS